MNNRGFQQHQNNIRHNQQAADQNRRTQANMQRQQAMVQQGRENSRRLQHSQKGSGGNCLGSFVTLLVIVYLVYMFSHMH